MPARKHRAGEPLDKWLAQKARHAEQRAMARAQVKSLTKNVLLRPVEAAAMLSVTTKTLREMEARGELPPRVVFSSKVFGWRLADLEASIRERMEARSPSDRELGA